MKKVEEIELTQHEWFNSLKVPTPHRNKKKYFRKEKHKKGWNSEGQFIYLRIKEIKIKVMFEEQVFWKDGFDGTAKGGLHFRSFDLNQFIKKVEEDGTEVVGIKFEGNNLELIVKK